MIKVSVCITTYNLVRYIQETIDSVLNQKTSFEYEIIIGDDYSTDGTRDILLQYRELYPNKIILHFQEKNVGVNKNDYDLIRLAKGEYIAWCDGDDYWIDEHKLEKQVQILDSNIGFSCVHTAWKDYIQAKNVYEDHYIQQKEWERVLKGHKYIDRFLLSMTTGCRFSSLMYRREYVLDFINKDASIYLTIPHLQNDFALFCILSNYGPFYYLNEITTIYRIRESSLSQTDDEKKRFLYNLALLHLKVYLLHYNNSSQSVIQICIRKNLEGLMYYILKYSEYYYLSEIRKQCKNVNYKFSFGQNLIILSETFHCLRGVLNRLVKYKTRIKHVGFTGCFR